MGQRSRPGRWHQRSGHLGLGAQPVGHFIGKSTPFGVGGKGFFGPAPPPAKAPAGAAYVMTAGFFNDGCGDLTFGFAPLVGPGIGSVNPLTVLGSAILGTDQTNNGTLNFSLGGIVAQNAFATLTIADTLAGPIVFHSAAAVYFQDVTQANWNFPESVGIALFANGGTYHVVLA